MDELIADNLYMVKTPDSEKPEGEVKMEQTPVVSAPISETMKQKNEAAREKLREVEKEIEKRLQKMRIQLQAELGTEANANFDRITREVGSEAQKSLQTWLSDIYQGKHGRLGTLPLLGCY